jgi:hypothetical protein
MRFDVPEHNLQVHLGGVFLVKSGRNLSDFDALTFYQS